MMYVVWVLLPCAAVVSFAGGHLWRYRRDRFRGPRYGPYADTAQRLGALSFRIGVPVLFVARIAEVLASGPHSRPGGHIGPFLITLQVIAIPLAVAGAAVLLIPPLIAADAHARVSPLDRITLPVLIAALLSSILVSFDPHSTDHGYLAAETLFTWVRSLVTLHPDAAVMQHAPAMYQARGLIVMLLVAIWPYTRLAGVFTVPTARLLRKLARTGVFRRQPVLGAPDPA
ncbi:respiratory nitrate reductase subunit gamma [Nocardia sp. NPDC088792]|uniref:respiratory nitrate reductase subunit gamma n=1 Tax=Nocardia sp. NPDC088792 TaxID=3364332 RepID=UPI0038016CA5